MTCLSFSLVSRYTDCHVLLIVCVLNPAAVGTVNGPPTTRMCSRKTFFCGPGEVPQKLLLCQDAPCYYFPLGPSHLLDFRERLYEHLLDDSCFPRLFLFSCVDGSLGKTKGD